jgi:hypothetical protein
VLSDADSQADVRAAAAASAALEERVVARVIVGASTSVPSASIGALLHTQAALQLRLETLEKAFDTDQKLTLRTLETLLRN